MSACVPFDDPDILDEALLIRRVHPLQIVPDENTGGKRVSSAAFSPSSDPHFGMSIDIKKSIENAGEKPEVFVKDPKHVGAVEFTASVVRNLNFVVGSNPLPPENPHHGEVWKPDSKRFSKGAQNQILRASKWLNEIAGVNLGP